MQLNRIFPVIILSLISTVAVAANRLTVTVSNTSPVERDGEMVAVSADDLQRKLLKGVEGKLDEFSFRVTDKEGTEIPSQHTWDGFLIFPTNVAAKSKAVYYITCDAPGNYEPKVMGRLFTEREDEFGWENDKVAYRIYGHGAAVGYDLFNKKTSKLMLNHWYASEQDKEMRSVSKKLRDRGYADLADEVYNAFSYHIDHGEGMDCYTVGPTLGGGANALVAGDGTLIMPKCYDKFDIVDNGPLRFTVKLTYPAVNGVEEVRIISLDAGSHFCKVRVIYNGLGNNTLMASGVVVHQQNPTAYVMNRTAGYLGYEDLGDGSVYNKNYRAELEKQMGRIYVGTVYPDEVKEIKFIPGKTGIATGHLVALTDSYTYYFGNAWDKNVSEGITSLALWESMLNRQSTIVRHPLRVDIR